MANSFNLQPELTHQEVAECLGCSRAAVEMTERRALKKLRAVITKMGLSLDDLIGEKPQRMPAVFRKRGGRAVSADERDATQFAKESPT